MPTAIDWKALLQRMRQAICLHGPVGHADIVVRDAEEPDIYAFDFCQRCRKTLMKYSDA